MSASTDSSSRFAPQVTCLLILLALIDSQVVSAIAPQIGKGLDADQALVASAATVYSVAAALVALGLARLSRLQSPHRFLPAAGALFAVSSLLTAAAPNLALFYAGRAGCGCAGGLISALAIAALANASSYDKRGGQMSWVAISYFLAPVLGVPIATFLTGQFSWRTTFLASAIAVGAASVLVRALPLPSSEPVENAETTPDRSALSTLWRLGTHSRSARNGLISAFFVSGGLVGFTAFLGVWLNNGFGAGTREVGLTYGLAGLGAVAGGALGGKLSDRYGKRIFAARGSVALALMLLLVPGFTWGLPLWVMIAVTAFIAALRVAPLQALVTEIVSPSERPAYIALRNGASQLGIASAVAGAGWLYGRMGFMGVGLLCAGLSLVAWFSLRRIDDPHEHREGAAVRPKRGILFRIARAVVVAVLFLLLALPWSLSFLVTKPFTRPNEQNETTPATYGHSFEDISFKSIDGNTLSGWFVPGTQPVTIVMAHGLFRSRFELLNRAADLAALGYSVVVIDLRRHGKSPAEFGTLGYAERHDIEAAMAFARGRTPSNKLVLFGVSMGAAASLLAASETSGVDAVIADSSFLSLEHTVYHHLSLPKSPLPVYPFAPMLVWITSVRLNFLPGRFDVLEAVREIQCPILFIGGTDDIRMPIATVLEPLYEAAPNPGKQKFVVKDAGHGHAYETDPTGYIAAVNAFLQKAVVSQPAG